MLKLHWRGGLAGPSLLLARLFRPPDSSLSAHFVNLGTLSVVDFGWEGHKFDQTRDVIGKPLADGCRFLEIPT